MSSNDDSQRSMTPRQGLSSYEQPEADSPDIQEIHRAVLREQFEPSEGQQRVPIALFLLFIGLAMWAGYYLSEYDGNFQPNVYDGPEAFRLMDLAKASVKTERKVDPLLLGKRLFNNCSACHQPSGEGVPGKYPPLNQSEWVLGDDRILARILLNGLNGPVVVRGSAFNDQMPAWKHLSDRDIAAVLTYIRQTWDNKGATVDEATIAAVRSEVGSRTQPFTSDELAALELPKVRTASPAKSAKTELETKP